MCSTGVIPCTTHSTRAGGAGSVSPNVQWANQHKRENARDRSSEWSSPLATRLAGASASKPVDISPTLRLRACSSPAVEALLARSSEADDDEEEEEEEEEFDFWLAALAADDDDDDEAEEESDS